MAGQKLGVGLAWVCITLLGCRAQPVVETDYVYRVETVEGQTPIDVQHTPSSTRERTRVHLDELLVELDAAQQVYDATPEEPAVVAELARINYFIGVNESPNHSAAADRLFEDLSNLRPDWVWVQAYLGSGRVLRASRVDNNFQALGLVRQGMGAIDRTVEALPDNLEVRFLRARTGLELPGFFGRRGQSASDFAWLAERVESALVRDEIDQRMTASSLYHHGVNRWLAGHEVEAMAWWARAEAAGPGTIGAMLASDLRAGRTVVAEPIVAPAHGTAPVQ